MKRFVSTEDLIIFSVQNDEKNFNMETTWRVTILSRGLDYGDKNWANQINTTKTEDTYFCYTRAMK